MPQGRFFRPKEKSLLGTKYDSSLEQKLDQLLSKIIAGSLTTSVSHLTSITSIQTGPKLNSEPSPTLPDLPISAKPLKSNEPTLSECNVTNEQPSKPEQQLKLKQDAVCVNEPSKLSNKHQLEVPGLPLQVPSLQVQFHADKVPYTISHTYNPDFTLTYPDGSTIFIEAKGYFQDAQEIMKYPAVRDCLGENQELVFVFEKPEKPIHFRTKRKDGTKMSHGEWATKNGFRYFTLETVGELIDQ